MDFAYMIENKGLEDKRDNKPLIRLIRDLQMHENQVIIGKAVLQDTWMKIESELNPGDRLLVLTVADIANSLPSLLAMAEKLHNKQIVLCSLKESFLSGSEYYDSLLGYKAMHVHFVEIHRKEKYRLAQQAGTVGRPKMTEEIEKALRLYRTKSFTIEEIEKLAGVSSSTIYRALKEDQNQEKTGSK